MKTKHGAVDTAKTIKAGCGIRYDPEQLSEDTGFDFSDAANLVQGQQSSSQQHSPETSRQDSKASALKNGGDS